MPALTKLFGFAQFDFAGTLPLGDGRYLARDSRSDGAESVLVVLTLGASPAPARRRRRPRQAEPGSEPASLPLTRVTAVRAYAPFASEEAAARWLDEALEAEDTSDVLVEEGIDLLNRALHAHAVAAADPRATALNAERAAAVRLGYGEGEAVAESQFSTAREIDVRGGASRRRRREDDLRPQERLAAILGGREEADACETLLLRARADLDAGRLREAALQLRVGFEALLAELQDAIADPGHRDDMTILDERRGEVGEAANRALRGDLSPEQVGQVSELMEICERVLRRRRILRE
jgi:hypothetical protein